MIFWERVVFLWYTLHTMASITFSLSSVVRSDGCARLLLRLSVCRGVKPRGKTEIFVPIEHWNGSRIVVPRALSPQTKKLLAIKREIDALESFILDQVINSSSPINREWLASTIRKYHHPTVRAAGSELFAAFDHFLSIRGYSESRRNAFGVLRRVLHRFELIDGAPLTPGSFDHLMIERFDRFLRDDHIYAKNPDFAYIYDHIEGGRKPQARSQNTVNLMHNELRAFVNWLCEQELTDTNGYRKFKVGGDVYGTPIYITTEERNRIYEANMPTPQLAVQRDIFVFQCLVGCRVGDMVTLRKENVINGALEYVARKTKDGRPITVRVPLHPRAIEIINRYSNDDERLLPFVVGQAYNRAIKEVFKAAGIERLVMWLDPKSRQARPRPLYEIASSHMARRTFAGNLYQKLKDPNIIASMTGHKEGSRAFARYRAIDDTVKAEAVALLD